MGVGNFQIGRHIIRHFFSLYPEDAGEESSGYTRAEETEPCDATSGYIRKDEDEEDQETCDNSSGYVRNKDDDQDKDDTGG